VRRHVVTGIAACFVAMAAAGCVLLSVNGHDSPPPNRGTTSKPSSPPETDARQVAEALGRLVSDPESLVASGAGEEMAGQAREAIPVGSRVDVDESSWAPDGTGGGVITVEVTSPGQGTTEYAAIMVLEGDAWKVAATVPLTDQTPPGISTR
jgi:hypothetical protein